LDLEVKPRGRDPQSTCPAEPYWTAKWTAELSAAVFDVVCPTCAKRALLTPRRIESLENTPDGIVIRWRCWCGTGGELRTGRTQREEAEEEVAAEPGDAISAAAG
jgi:hypothetical protein